MLLIHVGALMQNLKNLLNLSFLKYALTTFILKKLLLIKKAHPCARNIILTLSKRVALNLTLI